MELASNFADKAASVTCVGRSSIPFANVLGEKIGAMLKKVMDALLTRTQSISTRKRECLCRCGEQGTAQGCLGVGHEHSRLIKRQTAYLPKQSLIILFSYCEE